jgi:hypothetical protein
LQVVSIMKKMLSDLIQKLSILKQRERMKLRENKKPRYKNEVQNIHKQVSIVSLHFENNTTFLFALHQLNTPVYKACKIIPLQQSL